ncbi:MAG: glycosyltransferase family 39 protein, partial [Victivallaceae bacterium]|nr:glycosyltransferase family 39 protein [Victivallaceae bacterium]
MCFKKNVARFLPLTVLFAGIVLRLYFLKYDACFMTRDGALYLKIAKTVAEYGWGSVPADFHTPALYVAAIAELKKIHVPEITAALGINFVCGVLLLPLVFGIARRFFHSRAVALWAMVFAAVHPTLVEFSCKTGREMMYLFLLALAVFIALWAINSRRPGYGAVISGIAVGFAVWTRTEAAEMLFFPWLAMIFVSAPLRGKILRFTVVFTVFALLATAELS